MKSDTLRDVLVFGGVLVASIGVGLWSIPAALVAFGSSIAGIGLFYR